MWLKTLIIIVIFLDYPLIGWSIDPIEPQMIIIPEGYFLYGTTEDTRDKIFIPHNESAQKKIYCATFAIGKYEVTEIEYLQFVLDDGYETDRYWSAEEVRFRPRYKIHKEKFMHQVQRNDQDSRLPVRGASWYEAEAYCNWLSEKTGIFYHLPSDIQWEKAARGTDGLLWPWGNEWEPTRCNWMDRRPGLLGVEPDGFFDGYTQTAPVGSYPSGMSPYGCMDMAGNVQEWCSDWFDQTRQIYKVIRGGSFYTSKQRNLRCARRGGYFPEFAFVNRLVNGFRLASDNYSQK